MTGDEGEASSGDGTGGDSLSVEEGVDLTDSGG